VNLHEYQSKAILARYGIPVLSGGVASSPQEAYDNAKRLGERVVLKAQVLTHGRGQAGGIRIVNSAEDARQVAAQMLGMTIGRFTAQRLLIEPIIGIRQELYIGVVLDRSARSPVIMASPAGGVAIRSRSGGVSREMLDPDLGLHDFQARALANSIQLEREHWSAFISIAQALSRCFFENDCTLAEINPLALTEDGRLIALDSNLILDDNALFRHPDLAEMYDGLAEHPLERRARQAGLRYVGLGGDIGCMVNGAGLAMTTMDAIGYVSALAKPHNTISNANIMPHAPANFLDLGGGALAHQVAAGLRVILNDPNVRAILINIFGGITRADEVAEGILTVAVESDPNIPIICRLAGTNADEGRALLRAAELAHLHLAITLIEAAERAISAVGGARP